MSPQEVFSLLCLSTPILFAHKTRAKYRSINRCRRTIANMTALIYESFSTLLLSNQLCGSKFLGL